MKQTIDNPDLPTREAQKHNSSKGEAPDFDLSSEKNRIEFGLWLAGIGFLIFLLGARPSLFGLDRSPVVGFVQISVFLVGLAFLAFGSALTLASFWPEGKQSIAAQVGSRLISTGYVICLFSGLADVLGLGSHPLPNVFFGPLQEKGMGLGMMTIALGFLLMIPYKWSKQHTSQEEEKTQEEKQERNKKYEQVQTESDQKQREFECVNFSFFKLFR